MASDGPQTGDILVLVGTRKGTFLFWSDENRREWQQSHHHMGWSTHAASYDPRHNTIYAGVNSDVFGGLVQRSTDGGRTWEHFNQGLDFAEGEERRVRQVWQVQAGHAKRPDEVLAGTRAAGLFRSSDRGAQWEAVRSLNDRAEADNWSEGGGGMILHTIFGDPSNADRVYVAVSTGGAYRSDDGGGHWKPINKGVRADFYPDPFPETGHCVHKMVMAAGSPNVLYQQNHCGVYRSDNAGEEWVDISEGLPSRFGFPMVAHPHDPATVYLVPLTADTERLVPDGRMTVWSSRDSGNSWRALTNGLPDSAWLSVLRDAMATDSCDTCGVYVGTTGGQLFYSRDEGESWQMLAEFLPPVLSVSAARVVG